MPFAARIVLHCRSGYRAELDEMVEKFIRERVAFVGVVGEDCVKVEDIIDELVVGDGSDPSRFILTSSHPYETINEVVVFAESISVGSPGPVQIVEL